MRTWKEKFNVIYRSFRIDSHSTPGRAAGGSTSVRQEAKRNEGRHRSQLSLGFLWEARQGRANSLGLASLNKSGEL